MSRQKYFKLVAKDITYYGENLLPFWKRIFLKPPRKYISEARRSSRKRAEEDLRPPAFYKWGKKFEVATYSVGTIRA